MEGRTASRGVWRRRKKGIVASRSFVRGRKGKNIVYRHATAGSCVYVFEAGWYTLGRFKKPRFLHILTCIYSWVHCWEKKYSQNRRHVPRYLILPHKFESYCQNAIFDNFHVRISKWSSSMLLVLASKGIVWKKESIGKYPILPHRYWIFWHLEIELVNN